MANLNSENGSMQDNAANTTNDPTNKVLANGIFVKVQDYFRKIPYDDIIYIEASGSYCNIYIKSKIKITVAYTLSSVMDCLLLSNKRFIRIHRSFVINLDEITGYIGNSLLIGEKMLPIGRIYRKDVFSHLNVLGTIS